MSTLSIDSIHLLQDEDQDKISYFAELLFQKEKYQHLKAEISERKKEIQDENTLSHNEIWDSLDV